MRAASKGGRPSRGLSEAAVLLRLPRVLLAEITQRSLKEKVPRVEWIREAVRLRLAAK